MVYSRSSANTRTPTRRELYADPTYDDVLSYRADVIPAISESSVDFALQQLAPASLSYQPITLDHRLDRGIVRTTSNAAWPTPDSAPLNNCYQYTLGHNTFAVDPGVRVPDSGYSSPARYSSNTDWNSWYTQGRGTSSSSFSSAPPPLSSGTADARRFGCSECPSSFTQKKDLNRHMYSVHPTGNEPFYRCRCGREGVRKDNYLRHLDTCYNEEYYPVYTCKCGHNCEDKVTHIGHVGPCRYGFGPVGRPRGR